MDDLIPVKRRKTELSAQDGFVFVGITSCYSSTDIILNDVYETHPGPFRMKSLAISYFWWPHMDSDIERKVKTCETCQINRTLHNLQSYIIGPAQQKHDLIFIWILLVIFYESFIQLSWMFIPSGWKS